MSTASPKTAPPPRSEPYRPQNHVRLVTAASLFDGHDAAINVMRRILQSSGAEVIHLGHNRSVAEIVDCAVEEDAQGIALTSYQGGHVEYLKYMYDLLRQRGADIRIFAGGGGTILPSEIEELHAYGIDRIYSPDDGRELGLQGMINDLLRRCDFAVDSAPADDALADLRAKDPAVIGRLITDRRELARPVRAAGTQAGQSRRREGQPGARGSPAPEAVASPRWSMNSSAGSSPTSTTSTSRSSRSTRPSARPAARCWATASG